MAIITWLGGTSTNAGVAANWVGGSLPTSSDVVYFNSASALVNQPIFLANSTFQAFHIGSSQRAASGPKIHTNITITLTGDSNGEHLIIEEAESLEASSGAKIKFTGAVDSDNTYVKFNAGTGLDQTELGMFQDSSSRSNMTFIFEPGTNITLELANGVYPNLEGVASSNTCTLSATAPLNTVSSTSYTTVDILNLTVDANFKISPARQTEADFAKTFNLEGNLIIQTDTFFWGNSTVRFIPQNGNGSTDASSPFPVSGMYKNTSNYDFGNQTTKDFNAKYNKIIIGYVTNKKFILPASSILMCNHLEIESGGRLYGPDTTAIEGAEIHSIQRPTIHGDWNFTQIADGIYRTRKTLLPQQEYHDILSTNRNHYGINGDVLSITGGKLAWSSSAGGSSFAVSDITGATELASGLADADELVLSDGGVLKRMDISVLKTYMQAGLTFTTNTNTQNTTTLSFVDSSNDIILRNTTGGAGSGTDDIKFVAGSNITLTHTDADNITIASTDTNTDVDVSVANLKTRLAGGFGSNAVTIGDSDDVVTIGNDLVVTGDLTVSGTTTTLNTATLDVEDLNITVGKAANSSSAANGAGLTFGAWSSGTIPTLTWVHADSRLAVNKTLYSSGGFVGLLTGNVTGNVSGNAGTVTLGSDNGSVSHFLTFSDSATGSQALKTDDTLTYIPSSGRLTTNVFVGDLAGDVTGDVTGDLTGNADTVTNGVYTTGNQSIAGVKTFTSSPLLKAGLDLVNPNLAGAMGITLQNEDGKFLLYTDEGQLVIKDFLVDTGASTDGTDTFPFKLQSGAATDTFIIKTGGRVDVSGALYAGSFVGDVTGNVSGSAATATALATARAINGVNFDGTADITITAAGSTLSDTVTVAKGGTGATTLTSNAVLTGNGTSAIQAESTFTYDGAGIAVITGALPQLQLVDSDATNSPMARIMNNNGNLSIRADSSNVGTGGAINFQTSGSEKMRIQDNGNVGIGTASPSQALDVAGSIHLTGDIFLAQEKKIQFDSGDTHITTNADNPEDLFISVDQDLFLRPDNDVLVQVGTTTYTIFDGTNQRVGIGTTSPSEKLHVVGNILVNNNGSIKANGSGSLTLGNTNNGLIKVHGNGSSSIIEGYVNHLVLQTLRDDDDIIFNVNAGGTDSDSTVVEAMRIVGSDGRVGIGTTSPSAPLHIYTTSTSEPSLLIENDEANAPADAIIRLQSSGGSNTWIDFIQNTYGQLDITGGGSTRRQILTVDDPDSNDACTISFNKEHYDWNTQIFGDSSTPAIFVEGGNSNVGIGTASPSNTLHVESADEKLALFKSTDAGAGIQIDSPNDGYSVVFFSEGGTDKWSLGKLANNSDKFSIYDEVNNTPRLVIASSGYVGIGTTSPTHKLHLHDASRVDIKFSNDNDESHYIRKDGDYLRIRGEDDSTVLMEIRNNSSSNFVSFPSGNVGIGTTTPGTSLHVADAAEVTLSVDSSHATGAQISLDSTGTGGDEWRIVSGANSAGIGGGAFGLYNVDTSSYRFNVTSAGNVGIGTASPQHKLDIDGNLFLGKSGESTALTGSPQIFVQGDTAVATFTADNTSSGDQIAGIRVFGDSYRSIGMVIGDYNSSNGSVTEDWIFGRQYASASKAGIFAAPENGGDEYITANSDSQKAVKIAGDNDDIDFIIHGSNGEYFRAEASTGRVGIGTTSPSTVLHVKGSGVQKITVESTDNEAALELSSDSSGPWVINSGNGSNDLRWYGNGAVRMQLTSDGKLGIGETAPSFPLHLKYTDNRTDPQGSNSSSGAGAIGANAQGGGLYIENASTTDGSFAGITFRTDTADGRIAYQSTGSSLINEGQMSFYCDANDTGGQQLVLEEVLRLTGGGSGAAQAYNSAYVNGRLGVGTATPSTALQVSGTVTATAFAGDLTGDVTGNSDTATLAATVTVAQDNTADATHYINFTDDNTGANAIKVDTGLTYNPSSNMITATRFEGALIGNADTVTNGVYTSGDQTIAGVKTLSSYMILTGDTTAAPSDLTSVHLGEDGGQLEIRTQYGTTQIGSTNTSWNHIEGSANRFYFNKPVIIDGNGTYGNLSSYSTEDLILGTNSGTETRITIKQDTGNVGIGTTSPTHKLHVNGSFTATTKEFTIPHPTKKGKTLSHGSLEGPEYGVYVRGKSKDRKVYLPDYWKDLVHEDNITVQLTPIGKSENLYVVDYNTEYIEVENDVEYFYYVQAERKDVDKLEVEF